jgi:putative transferase (TIGR04331 family)
MQLPKPDQQYPTLVTTHLKETWPKTLNNALFLGQWCIPYGVKSSKIDAKIIPYHWDSREKLDIDYKYLNGVYENILEKISTRLNEIHGINYSLFSWRIILGPWLGFFIQILFDRWSMVNIAVQNNEMLFCNVIAKDIEKFIPNDMVEFTNFYLSASWNEYIYGEIIEKYFSDRILVSHIHQSENKLKKTKKYRNLKIIIIKKVISVYNKITTGKNDALFISTYIPKFKELLIQLKFRQIPKIWFSPKINDLPYSELMRNWQLDGSGKDVFLKIANQLVVKNIPKAYLEGFKQLNHASKKIGWPLNPRLVFTATSHENNDLFKLWLAWQRERLEFPLIILQHGGHFGMNKFSFHEEHQIRISNKWLSWGWSDKTRPNIYPLGITKVIGKKPSANRSKCKYLMIQMATPKQSHHLSAFPIAGQWLEYFQDQEDFIGSLPEKILKDIQIRLSPSDYGWKQRERYGELLDTKQFSPIRRGVYEDMAESKVCIISYNATTLLEAIALNIPTIAFWNEEHWEASDDFKSLLVELKKVGIFHSNPISASGHLQRISEDVLGWWNHQQTQLVVGLFSNQFAKTIKSPINDIYEVLNEK